VGGPSASRGAALHREPMYRDIACNETWVGEIMGGGAVGKLVTKKNLSWRFLMVARSHREMECL
jgi:hypothetical protein